MKNLNRVSLRDDTPEERGMRAASSVGQRPGRPIQKSSPNRHTGCQNAAVTLSVYSSFNPGERVFIPQRYASPRERTSEPISATTSPTRDLRQRLEIGERRRPDVAAVGVGHTVDQLVEAYLPLRPLDCMVDLLE